MEHVYIHFCLASPHRLPSSPATFLQMGQGVFESALQVLVQLQHITWHITRHDSLHVIGLLSQMGFLDKQQRRWQNNQH